MYIYNKKNKRIIRLIIICNGCVKIRSFRIDNTLKTSTFLAQTLLRRKREKKSLIFFFLNSKLLWNRVNSKFFWILAFLLYLRTQYSAKKVDFMNKYIFKKWLFYIWTALMLSSKYIKFTHSVQNLVSAGQNTENFIMPFDK